MRKKASLLFLLSGLFTLSIVIALKSFCETEIHKNFLVYTFAALAAMYTLLVFVYSIGICFFEKYISIFEKLAIKLLTGIKGKKLYTLIDVALIVLYILLLSGGVYAIINQNLIEVYYLVVLFIIFPIIVFFSTMARKLKYTPKLACLAQYIGKLYNKLYLITTNVFILRRVFFVVREIVSIRSFCFFCAIYFFAVTFNEKTEQQNIYVAIFAYMLAIIVALLVWTYWNDNGVERLRTRQLIVRFLGFAILMLNTYSTIFSTQDKFFVAFIGAAISIYMLADSTVKHIRDDRMLFDQNIRSKLENQHH